MVRFITRLNSTLHRFTGTTREPHKNENEFDERWAGTRDNTASSRHFGWLGEANPVFEWRVDERGNLNYPFRLSINFYRLSLRQLSGSTTARSEAAENGGSPRRLDEILH
jgi:hypothetical protein